MGSWHGESQRKCVVRVRGAPVGPSLQTRRLVIRRGRRPGFERSNGAHGCPQWLRNTRLPPCVVGALSLPSWRAPQAGMWFPLPSATSTVCSRPSPPPPALQDAVSLLVAAGLQQRAAGHDVRVHRRVAIRVTRRSCRGPMRGWRKLRSRLTRPLELLAALLLPAAAAAAPLPFGVWWHAPFFSGGGYR